MRRPGASCKEGTVPPSKPRANKRIVHILAPAIGATLIVLACAARAGNGDFGRTGPSIFDRIGSLRNGDFDRPAPGPFDGLLPKQLTLGPAIRVPGNPLTDAEEELRNRAYDLIRLPQRREKWKLILASARVAKALPWSIASIDPTAYGNMLVGMPFRSEVGRYSRLMDDVISDTMLIGPFTSVACWVIDMDCKRERSLPFVVGLTVTEFADAEGRIVENRLVIDWVKYSLLERAWSYRYAVERLVIASPSPMAVDAERSIDRLRAQIDIMDSQLSRCADAALASQTVPPPAQVIRKD
jgi:hypothetical protein